ncbi:hypothetical protein WL93_21915 [Burkholderia diffusa]|nr:hypothetical protein WL93_21915 [Burkholderia diffusa]
MRDKGHGYADAEATKNGSILGSGPWPLPGLSKELLDQLVKGPMTPAEVQDLKLVFNKTVIERAMGAEMNLHPDSPSGQPESSGQANERDGASGKTVITDRGPARVEVPAIATPATCHL